MKRFLIPFLFILLMVVMIVSFYIGPASISPNQANQILFNHLSGRVSPSDVDIIIWDIRIPRVLLGILAGAMLAISGTILQGILRNPLADPYILGVSSGAGVGAALAFVLNLNLTLLGLNSVPLLAFLGALLAVLIVYRISRVGGRTSPETLILAGVAVGAFAGAVLSFLVITSDKLLPIYFWLLGGLNYGGWAQVWVVLPYALIGALIALLFSRDLNVLLLGEESALSLGVEVEGVRLILLAVASLMTGAAVAACGLIGFIGLIIPHFVRLIVGPDHRLVLPISALGGAILLILADILARTLISPAEIPIGIVTAIMGAPFFLYLLRKRRSGK